MVVSLLALLLAGTPVPEPGNAIRDAAVVVRGGAWAGSGVVWDVSARLVLTALHVVEEMPPAGIEVVGHDGVSFRARVIDSEPLLDLALLKVEGALAGGFLPLGLGTALAPGDAIALAVCPKARCVRGVGRVLMAVRRFAGSRYLAIAGEARPGASGGAVLDARGAIVGIVDLTLGWEPGVALAIPIERAAERFPRASSR